MSDKNVSEEVSSFWQYNSLWGTTCSVSAVAELLVHDNTIPVFSCLTALVHWRQVTVTLSMTLVSIFVFYIVQSSQLVARVLINDLLTYLLTIIPAYRNLLLLQC